MKPQEDDDWFDRIMLFLANWSSPIVGEFFKLLEWLFLMAALSFLTIKSQNFIFDILLYLSIVMVWFYMMFGYNKFWHKKFHTKIAKHDDGMQTTMIKNHLIWSAGFLVIIILSRLFFYLANLFGREAALILYK